MTSENEEVQKSADNQIDTDEVIYGLTESDGIDPSMLMDESSRIVSDLNSGDNQAFQSFEEANLDPRLLEAIRQLGWERPTPVQGLCLPFTLKGRDVAGFAQTGTGKTGVFLATFAQRFLARDDKKANQVNGTAMPFAVVLAPTRELAIQIHEDAVSFLAPIGAKSLAVFGGMDYEKQASDLRGGIDLVVATPGRLKDYFQKKIISMRDCGLFVCDEVDRMFDMGFVDDVEYFLEKIPENAQKLLFSATTNEKVKELAFEYLEKPEYISVNPEVITPENIEQHAILCDSTNKLKVMIGLLREHNPSRAVIFINTKLTAQWLHYKLKGNGISADVITGDLPQRKRISLMTKLKEGKVRILIATDVASRGLHISDITHVYNFDLPDEAANYVHRIGRTARAGAKGVSFSLVCEEYGENFEKIKALLGEAAPRSVWFRESYLEIKDAAGNPFEDNFGVRVTEEPSTGRGPQRDRPRPGGPERPRSAATAERPRSGNQSQEQRPARPQHPRGPKPQHAGARDGTADRNRSRGNGKQGQRDQNRQGHSQRSDKPNITGTPVAASAKESVPTTTTGFIKKVFGLLFGRK
jgi:ATP-dependent RNA helicase RhlB